MRVQSSFICNNQKLKTVEYYSTEKKKKKKKEGTLIHGATWMNLETY